MPRLDRGVYVEVTVPESIDFYLGRSAVQLHLQLKGREVADE